MRLVKIGDRIYNFDLLVDAEFIPPTSGINEETNKEFSRTAKLELHFAVSESEPHTNYAGDYTGFAIHSLYCRILRDEDAMTAWNWLCHETQGK